MTIALGRACRITMSRSPRSEPGPEGSNPLKQHRARNSRRPCRSRSPVDASDEVPRRVNECLTLGTHDRHVQDAAIRQDEKWQQELSRLHDDCAVALHKSELTSITR